MEYQQSRGDCPVTLNVTPRYQSASLEVVASDPDAYYRISGVPEALLSALDADESIWGELLMWDDIDYIYAVAELCDAPFLKSTSKWV